MGNDFLSHVRSNTDPLNDFLWVQSYVQKHNENLIDQQAAFYYISSYYLLVSL